MKTNQDHLSAPGSSVTPPIPSAEAVYHALSPRARLRTSPENVADVLAALAHVSGGPAKQAPNFESWWWVSKYCTRGEWEPIARAGWNAALAAHGVTKASA